MFFFCVQLSDQLEANGLLKTRIEQLESACFIEVTNRVSDRYRMGLKAKILQRFSFAQDNYSDRELNVTFRTPTVLVFSQFLYLSRVILSREKQQ